jgi:hypothetical protein
MNTTITSAGAVTPFAKVARAAGLEEWALRKLLADAGPSLLLECLTPDNILEVGRIAEKRGYAVMAHSLRVLARQQIDTPSRNLLPPIAKNAPVQHAWQSRADLM